MPMVKGTKNKNSKKSNIRKEVSINSAKNGFIVNVNVYGNDYEQFQMVFEFLADAMDYIEKFMEKK